MATCGRRRFDRRPVRDVDPVAANAVVTTRLGGDVEHGHTHAARGEAVGVDLPHLAEAAGDDGHAAGEIEQLVGHACAIQIASQNSRTQPAPPARVSTQCACSLASGHASAGTTGSPTASRHVASLMSLPTYAVCSSSIPRADGLLAEQGQLLLDPLDALDAELARPHTDDRRRFHRHDQRLDADLAQAAEAEPIRAAAADALATVVVDPDVVVREDSVEVEDREPHRRERLARRRRRLSLQHAPPAPRGARAHRPSPARPREARG